jgi:protein O-mannosyl-transferase
MPEPSKKSLAIPIYALLVAATLLAFWQVNRFGFINYDDNDYVYENPLVLNGLTANGVISTFTAAHARGNWMPLTWISFMFDVQVSGVDAGWMHMVNLLLHVANAVLLLAILWRLTGAMWASWFVAAAFALHPMHVESVAWIAERKDVLSTFFMLVTVVAYIWYIRRGGVLRYVLVALLFAAGLMTKPMLVTLPLLLLLLDYWPLGRLGRRVIIEKTPMFVLSAASCVVTFVVQRGSGSVADTAGFPLHIRAGNCLLSYARYIGKAFWPADLSVFYPFDAIALNAVSIAISGGLIIVVTVLVIRLRRREPYLMVGWLWFVISLVPVIGLVQSGAQSMADRYTYVPYIGLFVMAAWRLRSLVLRWPVTAWVIRAAATLVIVAMGIGAWRQTGCWRDSLSLFTQAIEVTGQNYIAYNGRGLYYLRRDEMAQAMKDLDTAISLKPDFPDTYNNRGVAWGKLGKWQEAMADLDRAIEVKSDYAEAYSNRGVVYEKLGRWDEAIGDFKRSIEIRPEYAKAHVNLGYAYSTVGQWPEAIEAYKNAVRIRPDDRESYCNLAVAYTHAGENDKAAEAYRRAGLSGQ